MAGHKCTGRQRAANAAAKRAPAKAGQRPRHLAARAGVAQRWGGPCRAGQPGQDKERGLPRCAGSAAAGRLILRSEQHGFQHRLAVAAQRAVRVDDGEAPEQLGHPAVLVVAQAQLPAKGGCAGATSDRRRTGVGAGSALAAWGKGMPRGPICTAWLGRWQACRGRAAAAHPQSPRPHTYSWPFWQMAALCQSPTETQTTFLPCGVRGRYPRR